MEKWHWCCEQWNLEQQNAIRALACWIKRSLFVAWRTWRREPVSKQLGNEQYFFDTTALMFQRLRNFRLQGGALATWRRVNSAMHLMEEAKVSSVLRQQGLSVYSETGCHMLPCAAMRGHLCLSCAVIAGRVAAAG